jgi:hypothetical protein
MRDRSVWIMIALAAAAVCAHAQWLNRPIPGTPRTKDGKPNLSAPAPKASTGKPDLSGIWQAEGARFEELVRYVPGGVNGFGEDDPSKYFFNILADFKPEDWPMRPEAAAAWRQQAAAAGKKPPTTLCNPPSVPLADSVPAPYKIVETRGLILILYEPDTFFRQIFTDGRKHPDDPQPSYLGSSVGKWEGDSLVVESVGFNDRGPLDAMGHRHSDAMRVTERFHRRDFGHMELQITVDDPKTFTKPFTFRVNQRLLPDTDLIESFCSEAEKDAAHMRGQ